MIIKLSDGTLREELSHSMTFKGTRKLKSSSGLLLPGDFPQFYMGYSFKVSQIEVCTTVPVGLTIYFDFPGETKIVHTLAAIANWKEELNNPFEIPSKIQFRIVPTFEVIERLVVVTLTGLLRKPVTWGTG